MKLVVLTGSLQIWAYGRDLIPHCQPYREVLRAPNSSQKEASMVGLTAMLLAFKYEEVSVPIVEDLVMISDKLLSLLWFPLVSFPSFHY